MKIVTAAVLPLAYAWNREGHEAIAMTASSASVRAATKNIKKLLDNDDIVDISYWAHDSADRKFEWARNMHFQPQPDTCSLTNLQCPDNGQLCILPMIKHFYNQLHKSLDKDAVRVTFPGNIEWSDQDALKLLSNLIADLHQPAHVGWQSWDMGRNKMVNFRGRQMSIYEFWDDALVATYADEEARMWYSGWTHIRNCKDDYDAALAQWREHGPKCFDMWAQESLTIGCEQIFQNPHFTNGGGVPDVDDVFIQAAEVMKRQILKAGVRTAVVMDALFTDEHQFSHGSAIHGASSAEFVLFHFIFFS